MATRDTSIRKETVPAGASGVVYTISRMLGTGSTLTLAAGTNSNLTLSGTAITAATALSPGSIQMAVVSEVGLDDSVTYKVLITSTGNAPALYLGAVATRGHIPNALVAANVEAMSQTRHILRDDVTSIAPLFGAWHLTDPATETALVGVTQVRASVSLSAAGPWTPFTFGGSATGAMASGANLKADDLPFSYPAGTVLFIRNWQRNDSGLALCGTPLRNSAGGDIASYGAAAVDRTAGGTISSSGSSALYPLAILGMTRRPSVLIVGDSRSYAVEDTFDATGDVGEVARSIGAAFGYINLSRRTMSANQFVTGDHSRRVALAQYVSHVVTNLPINDFYNEARSVAQAQGSLQAIWGYFPDKVVFATTVSPSTTGAWANADGSDQAIGASGTKADEVNTWLRTKPAPLAGYFETADQVSIGRGAAFKWRAGYTGDGLHALQTGMLAIRDSGAINVNLVVR